MRNHFLSVAAIIFIAGIFLTSRMVFASLGSAFFPIAIAGSVVLLAIFRKKDAVFLALLCLTIFFLGGFRYYSYNRIDKANIKYFITGNPVTVQGVIASDPEKSRSGKKVSFILNTQDVRMGKSAHEATGFLQVNSYNLEASELRYGDKVALEGVLNEPSSYSYKRSGFNYVEYLADRRVYAVLSVRKSSQVNKVGEEKGWAGIFPRTLYAVRNKIGNHIENHFEPPHDSLISAILLGKRSGIPRNITDSFSKTGTLHILAISGLHVGIIYFVLLFVLRLMKVPANASCIFSIAFLVCFAVLTGARASIVRATAMFSILALAGVFRRKVTIYNVIGLSCMAILLVRPNQVFNAGFILSYAAIISIIAISPVLFKVFRVNTALREKDLFKKKARFWLLRPFLVSLSVFLGLWPLIARYFAIICPIVVIANLLIIPLLILSMVSGILFITVGYLAGSIAVIFSGGTWLFLSILINTAKFLQNIPFGHFVVGPVGALTIISYYFILILILIALNTRAGQFWLDRA
jgi:competence protein ComEC